MPRPAGSVLALALAAALFVVAAGCGEEDAELLPGSTAREITSNLDTVQQLADEGDCVGAESAAIQVGEQVEALEGVDPRLKRALTDGAERLEEVVARCEEELEATEPLPDELESDAGAEREQEQEEEALEKQEEEERKEEQAREKEEEKRERAEGGDQGEGSPFLPPQAEGEGKGLDEDEDSGSAGEGSGEPSGGVSAANPAGGA